MKKTLKFIAIAAMLLSFAGCVAIDVTESSGNAMKQVSETGKVVTARVTGVSPEVTKSKKEAKIGVSLLGAFDVETTTYFASTQETEEYIAFGFFPGVMSCKGEYGDCFVNGFGAFMYNAICVGLPTVYGLIIEPFVPHHPQQTNYIICDSSFIKTSLVGFSKYSKPAEVKMYKQVRRSRVEKLPLADAVISAPSLGLKSKRGEPLRIPLSKIPRDGYLDITIRLPASHPLKNAMKDFEDVEITVSCPTK